MFHQNRQHLLCTTIPDVQYPCIAVSIFHESISSIFISMMATAVYKPWNLYPLFFFENCFIIYFIKTYQRHAYTIMLFFAGIAVSLVQVHLVLSHMMWPESTFHPLAAAVLSSMPFLARINFGKSCTVGSINFSVNKNTCIVVQ